MYKVLVVHRYSRGCFKVGLWHGRLCSRIWQSISGVYYLCCSRLSVDKVQHYIIRISDS